MSPKLAVIARNAHHPCLLRYALIELMSDVKKQLELLQEPQEVKEKIARETQFGIFVVHNKLKPKAAELPEGVAYFSGLDIPDAWVDYPWWVADLKAYFLLSLTSFVAGK